ncbi:hypothetical protein CO669_33030 [Bradyrhizobium sp. Y36]|uniref:hypothetical protein n=1 Tax=Bradyrhizobium sp. Y36 TaxID=2035447 RepID=UPI000BE8E320|nr:hypothetical protein [Bradyrhizobium sp. Y36]PDT83635.1 hypothetical protein CO669_33030 [Bradyrhizobium sp. Y36]
MSHLAGSEAFGRALTDTLIIYLDLDQSALGPTPPEVGAAVCRLLGLRGPDIALAPEKETVDDIYAIAHADLDRFQRNDPSGRAALIFVAYVSTFFHEARHVHDLLSTGFGLDILAAEFNYYQNALPLVGHLRKWQVSTSLSVPMPVAVDHPAIQSWTPRAARLIEGYTTLASRLERAGAPDRGIYGWMSNIHLLEASAGTVQLDIAHDLFGDEGIVLFDQLVRRGASARKYMWLINDFVELIQQRSKAREQIGRMMAFLLWTSLQGGRGDSSEPGLSPVAFFHAAADFVSRRADRANNVEQMQLLLDEFCTLWKLPLSAVTLTANEKRVQMRTGKFAQGWQAIDEAAPAHFADIFVGLSDAHLRLTKQIQTIPEIYFVGRFYSHAILLGHLPGLRVDFKFGDINHTAFTPGQPCLDPAVWDKAALYAAILSVLLKGRCTFPIPYLEDRAFRFMSDELGLRLKDRNFDF